MSPLSTDRRRFLLSGAALCLGPSAAFTQPGPQPPAQARDDSVKARFTVRIDSPDGSGGSDEVAFSADRRLVAVLQDDMRIRLWDTGTGNWLATLGGFRYDSADLLAIVNDGKTVLYWNGSGVGTCIAWDTKTAESRAVFHESERVGENARCSAAADPDGNRIAVCRSGGDAYSLIRVRDGDTGKELWEYESADERPVQFLAFSPDGKTLAAGGLDQKVRLFDAATGKERSALDCKDEVDSVEWSADGKLVSAILRRGKNIQLVVWDATTGKAVDSAGPFPRLPQQWALAPDAKHVAVVGGGANVMVWTVPGKEPLVSLRVLGRRAVSWTSDGKSLLVLREYVNARELLTFDLADIRK
jgi:WD40 repeat protein